MSERIILRTGEALVEGAEDYLAAEPEIVIGELDGPVGNALANLIGSQVKGHTKVFAVLNSDVQVRPATVMVSKVTVKDSKYTNILMGTAAGDGADLVERGYRGFVLEVGGVRDTGATVLGLLTTITRMVRREGGEAVLANVTPPMEKFLDTMQMDAYWDVFEDAEEAAAFL